MKVVVDGAVDMPLPRPGVTSVPAKVFKDRQPWSSELGQFWPALRSEPVGWITAPPTVSELAAAYRGIEPTLALHVSGELSSTLDHAREAAATSPEVAVLDSRSLSVGAGLTATRVDTSLDLPGASKRVAEIVARTHTYVLVEHVDYLLRSGRLGLFEGQHIRAKRHYLLAVKGHAIPLGHARSRERAFDSLLDHLRQTAPNGIEAWALSHGAATDAESLTARASQAIGSEPDFVVLVDPTVGIHVGPDAVILAALGRVDSGL